MLCYTFAFAKGLIMKKAFSMIELLFVIVIVGILSFALAPSFDNTKTLEAANQIISHIRYTQQLALNDDQFNPDDANWYKKMWRISFISKGTGDDKKWYYAVWRDDARDNTGNLNSIKEVAPDPGAPGKYLYNVFSNGKPDTNPNNNPKLDLTSSFGIKKIEFGGFKGTGTGSQTLVFDELGRVYSNSSADKSYDNKHDSVAAIQLTGDGGDEDSITIMIQPETGYACIAAGNIIDDKGKITDNPTCSADYNL